MISNRPLAPVRTDWVSTGNLYQWGQEAYVDSDTYQIDARTSYRAGSRGVEEFFEPIERPHLNNNYRPPTRSGDTPQPGRARLGRGRPRRHGDQRRHGRPTSCTRARRCSARAAARGSTAPRRASGDLPYRLVVGPRRTRPAARTPRAPRPSGGSTRRPRPRRGHRRCCRCCSSTTRSTPTPPAPPRAGRDLSVSAAHLPGAIGCGAHRPGRPGRLVRRRGALAEAVAGPLEGRRLDGEPAGAEGCDVRVAARQRRGRLGQLGQPDRDPRLRRALTPSPDHGRSDRHPPGRTARVSGGRSGGPALPRPTRSVDSRRTEDEGDGMTRAPLRVGLLGYGLAGRVFHAPLIAATPGLRLDAVVTRDPQRRAQVHADHPDARVLDDAEQLWRAAETLDLVVVAAPNRQHVPLARAAIGAGLPVVVDKPLAPTAAEGRALVAAAAAAGRTAHGVPEPPLGRRLPDRPPAHRARRAGPGGPLRVPVRAVAAGDQAGLAGERRPRGGRRRAVRPRRPPRSTRRCSCSARSIGSTPRWTGGDPVSRWTTTRSSR